jgi:hypothetical protein
MITCPQGCSPSSAAEWFAGVGTIVLALVAVFQQWFQRMLVRPKLRLTVRVMRPDAEKTRWKDGTEAYYFRLGITNVGNAEARDVQVYLASVEKRRKDSTYEVIDRYTPVNLLWAYLGSATRPVLVPGMPPVFCDLAYISDPSKQSKDARNRAADLSSDQVILVLQLEVKPFSGAHLLSPGIYRLGLKLVASNHPPRHYTLELDFPGKWFDDQDEMYSDGFGMRIVG